MQKFKTQKQKISSSVSSGVGKLKTNVQDLNLGDKTKKIADVSKGALESLKENIAHQFSDEIQVNGKNYKLGKLISEGGYGLVFVAKDEEANEYAIKRIPIGDSATFKLIKAECETMQILKGQENICPIVAYEMFKINKTGEKVVFIVMPLCSYTAHKVLNDRFEKGLVVPESQVWEIFTSACLAIAHMHSQNPPIAHRDLKPENLLFHEPSGKWLLCDFGSVTNETKNPQTETERETVKEDIARNTTVNYRSPEMIDLYSEYNISEQVDIWALGCLLFKLAFGQDAFADGVLAIANCKYFIPIELEDSFSTELKDMFKFLFIENPVERPTIVQVIDKISEITKKKIEIQIVEPNNVSNFADFEDAFVSGSSEGEQDKSTNSLDFAETDTPKAQKEVLDFKTQANQAYANNSVEEAISLYSTAIEENQKDFTLWSNRSACFLKTFKILECSGDCDRALKLNPNSIKCLLRKAICLEILNNLEESKQLYNKVQNLDSKRDFSEDVKLGLKRIQEIQIPLFSKVSTNSEKNKNKKKEKQNPMFDLNFTENKSETPPQQVNNTAGTSELNLFDTPVVENKTNTNINENILDLEFNSSTKNNSTPNNNDNILDFEFNNTSNNSTNNNQNADFFSGNDIPLQQQPTINLDFTDDNKNTTSNNSGGMDFGFQSNTNNNSKPVSNSDDLFASSLNSLSFSSKSDSSINTNSNTSGSPNLAPMGNSGFTGVQNNQSTPPRSPSPNYFVNLNSTQMPSYNQQQPNNLNMNGSNMSNSGFGNSNSNYSQTPKKAPVVSNNINSNQNKKKEDPNDPFAGLTANLTF